ncbi:MAG: hypothetical protein E3J72_04350 [Planctomycetota bacterium]|nr:MAG: hypothetical protein E3J72_04350 [Planctomycetota bacterium]
MDEPGSDKTEFDSERSHEPPEEMPADISEAATLTSAGATEEMVAQVVEEPGADAFTAVKQTARDVEARKLRGTAKVVKKDELNAVIDAMLQDRMLVVENEKAGAFADRDAAETKANSAENRSSELEEALARLQNELEQRVASFQERVTKLEAIIKQDEYKSKIMDLEYELHAVREAVAGLRLGFEFFNIVEDIDFGGALQELESLTGLMAQKEARAGGGPAFGYMRDRLQFIIASIKEDKRLFDSLKAALESGKGSVSVAFDLAHISWRCRGMLDETAIITRALELIN